MRVSVAVIAAAVLTACSQAETANEAALPASNMMVVTKPSASEIFELRSKCADLASDALQGVEGQRSQSSNYDARTNRCYADIGFMSEGYTETKGHFNRYLLEVQSNKVIAHIWIVDGRKEGQVNDWLDQKPVNNPTFAQVAKFFTETMRDKGD